MADPKPGSSLGPREVAVDRVDPATLAQLLALFAILAQTVAKVRLFEDTDNNRRHWFEADPPTAAELRPCADWLLAFPPAADEETVFVSSDPPRRRASAAHDLGNQPDLFLRALRGLVERDDGTHGASADTMAFLQSPGSERPSEPHTPWNILYSVFSRTSPKRNRVLDLYFHRTRRTWRVELSSTGLRGESLAELRVNAPLTRPGETPLRELHPDAYFTAPAAARYLGVDRSTVTRRVARNQLVGFTIFKRALRIPKDQFLGPDVLPGVVEVLALFAFRSIGSPDAIDHRSAWAFLSGDLYHGDAAPRPIDRLQAAAANGTTRLVLQDLIRAKESLDRGDHL